MALYFQSGTLFATYEYDAWGSCTIKNSSGNVIDPAQNPYHIAVRNPIRYRGYYYDQDTGFYYLQSRYYDPVVGRFLNADGMVSTGTGLGGYNMFAYCDNNPVMHADPTGTCLTCLYQLRANALGEDGAMRYWVCSDDGATVFANGRRSYDVTGASGKSTPKSSSDPEGLAAANCYTYAIDALRPLGQFLGEFSGNPLTPAELANPAAILAKAAADLAALGMTFTPVGSANHIPRPGNWLVALAYNSRGAGFHWWRQHNDGTWSHKLGNDVMLWDWSNPDLEILQAYDVFLGYYEIGPY